MCLFHNAINGTRSRYLRGKTLKGQITPVMDNTDKIAPLANGYTTPSRRD